MNVLEKIWSVLSFDVFEDTFWHTVGALSVILLWFTIATYSFVIFVNLWMQTLQEDNGIPLMYNFGLGKNGYFATLDDSAPMKSFISNLLLLPFAKMLIIPYNILAAISFSIIGVYIVPIILGTILFIRWVFWTSVSWVVLVFHNKSIEVTYAEYIVDWFGPFVCREDCFS